MTPAEFSKVLAEGAQIMGNRVNLMDGSASHEEYKHAHSVMTQMCATMHFGTQPQQEVAASLITMAMKSIAAAEQQM